MYDALRHWLDKQGMWLKHEEKRVAMVVQGADNSPDCCLALQAGAANATTPPTDADADALTEAADDADIVDDAPTADNSAFEAPTVENSVVI